MATHFSFFKPVLLFIFFLVPAFAHAQEAVKLEWGAIPDAKKYQIEITPQQNKKTPLVSQELDTPVITSMLLPGFYSYRVRTILSGNVAGPWSDYLDFAVYASVQKTTEPAHLAEVEVSKSSKPVKFKWQSSSPENKYRIQITGSAGMKEMMAGTNEFEWTPAMTGKYTWRVGFFNGAEVIWSEPQTLTVRQKMAEVAKAPAIQAATDVQSVDKKTTLKPAQKSTLDLTAWIGPVHSSYTGHYVDQSNYSSATTLSEVYGLTILTKSLNSVASPGVVLGADVSLRRQQMVHSVAALPSALASSGYYWNSTDWRHGLFTKIGVKTLGFFVIDNTTAYSSGTVTRFSMAAGAQTTRQISQKFSLGAGVTGGLDSGGHSDIINADFQPSPTLELIVSAALFQDEHLWNLNFSFKNENLVWNSQTGPSSSLNNSVTSLVLGLNL